MNKNLLLYILLAFLILVNGFFIFIFFNKPPKKGRSPGDFIVKELKFNEDQMQQFYKFSDEHHHEMRVLSEDIKKLKDALFSKISEEKIPQKKIDSIADLIGKKEQTKDISVFYHFQRVRTICNQEQKVHFDRLLKKALHRGGRKGP